MDGEPTNPHEQLRKNMILEYQDLSEREGVGIRNKNLITGDHPLALAKEQWNNDPLKPYVSFAFLGGSGYIRLDIWGVTNDGSLLTEAEIYSQGSDGKTKEEGEKMSKSGTQIAKSFAQITKRNIVDIAITHPKSDHIPPKLGYSDLNLDEIRANVQGSQSGGFLRTSAARAERLGYHLWSKEYRSDDEQIEPYPFTVKEIEKIEWMVQHIIKKD